MKAQHFTLIQQGACVGVLGWTCKVTNKIPCEGPYLRPTQTVIADYSILGSQEKWLKEAAGALKKKKSQRLGYLAGAQNELRAHGTSATVAS